MLRVKMMLVGLSILLVLNLIFFIISLILYSKSRKTPPKSPPKRLDKTAQDLLQEILSGPAIVKIHVIEKEGECGTLFGLFQ